MYVYMAVYRVNYNFTVQYEGRIRIIDLRVSALKLT